MQQKKHGTLISFDLNHRASFWKDREEELSAVFSEIASISDILIGNEEDFQLALGIKGPEAGGKSISDNIEAFKGLIENVKAKYPNAKVFANTLREVVSANRHLWGAILHSGNEWFVEEPREIEVLDRIGGGDGFVGGLLYGYSENGHLISGSSSHGQPAHLPQQCSPTMQALSMKIRFGASTRAMPVS